MSNVALTWARKQRAVSSAARHVLLILADCADADGRCWPTQPAIADEVGVTRTRISQIIGELADAGLLEIQGSAQRRSYRLRVNVANPEISEGKLDSPSGLASDTLRVSPTNPNPKEPSITLNSEADASAAVAAPADPVKAIFDRGLAILGGNRRSLLGRMRRDHGDEAVMAAILACEGEVPSDPAAFFVACLARAGPARKQSAVTNLYEGAMRAAEAYERRNSRPDCAPSLALLDGGRPH